MDVYVVLATWPSGEADIIVICATSALAHDIAERWTRMHPGGTTVIKRFTLVEA